MNWISSLPTKYVARAWASRKRRGEKGKKHFFSIARGGGKKEGKGKKEGERREEKKRKKRKEGKEEEKEKKRKEKKKKKKEKREKKGRTITSMCTIHTTTPITVPFIEHRV